MIYVLTGMFENATITTFRSASVIPGFGTAPTGDTIHEPAYLVATGDSQVRPEAVPQRRGGIRYAVDGNSIPEAIIFRPCGAFSDKCIIRGEVSFNAGNSASSSLYRIFLRTVTKGFHQVHGNLVGPEAYAICKSNGRLTRGIKVPSEYDLQL